MQYTRVKTPFDECDYQVVKCEPNRAETIAGYSYDECIEADEHCIALNAELAAQGIPESQLYYSLEMGPNVPEPE